MPGGPWKTKEKTVVFDIYRLPTRLDLTQSHFIVCLIPAAFPNFFSGGEVNSPVPSNEFTPAKQLFPGRTTLGTS